jgi:hypothetical protein
MEQKCLCKNPGLDDGGTTCWLHHDCTIGDCTHMDEEYDDYGGDLDG